jgi:hypothetical protein
VEKNKKGRRSFFSLEKVVIGLFAVIIIVYILIPGGGPDPADSELYALSLPDRVPTTPDGKAQQQTLRQQSKLREENLKRMADQVLSDPYPNGSIADSILRQVQQDRAADISLVEEMEPEPGEEVEPPADLITDLNTSCARSAEHKPPVKGGGPGPIRSPGPSRFIDYSCSPFALFKSAEAEDQVPFIRYGNLAPLTVFEGSFLEGCVQHRVRVDSQQSPVLVLVTRDFYSECGRFVVIPRGSRVLGTAQVVSDRNQSRLFTRFHRLILPNGVSVQLGREEGAKGLDRAGSLGLSSKVNRHTLRRYSGVLLLGLVEGLGALSQNRLSQVSPWSYFIDRGGRSLDRANDQVLRQALSVKPTITIEPGSCIKIYLCRDIRLSPFRQIDR